MSHLSIGHQFVAAASDAAETEHEDKMKRLVARDHFGSYRWRTEFLAVMDCISVVRMPQNDAAGVR
jgi:hypothetical protein